jgi:hypothetical protein
MQRLHVAICIYMYATLIAFHNNPAGIVDATKSSTLASSD